jgi:hypothetical protein
MKPGYTVIIWAVLLGLAAVFLIVPAASLVQAGVACVSTIPVTDGTDDNIGFEIRLAGKSLVWFKTSGELFHYNLKTAETRQPGLMQITGQADVETGATW